ncbi:hypothetical protein JR311_01880 [Bacillus velezensis]|uniref:hypothetical protein n=1 Tax=Bacillus velezensis TaxID=492670 RepID=UPI00195ED0E7|nr:hypothetical protein [Bacillus velezensis]QRV09718.1 hypothetical protein JR311_01880 [Bacillus velezensis]
MNWLEFVSSIINAWPLAVMVVVFILRNSLRSLINRIGNLTKLKYKDVLDMDFGEEVHKIKDELEYNSLIRGEGDKEKTGDIEETNRDQPLLVEKVMSVAKHSPQEAVYISWLELEKELRYLLVRVNAPNIDTIEEIVTFLKKEKHISTKQGNIIFSLHNLRDAVARDYPEARTIRYLDAMDYFKIVKELIKQFQEISSGYYDYTPSV